MRQTTKEIVERGLSRVQRLTDQRYATTTSQYVVESKLAAFSQAIHRRAINSLAVGSLSGSLERSSSFALLFSEAGVEEGKEDKQGRQDGQMRFHDEWSRNLEVDSDWLSVANDSSRGFGFSMTGLAPSNKMKKCTFPHEDFSAAGIRD